MTNPWKIALPSVLLGILLGGLGGAWCQRRAFKRLPDTERVLRRLTAKLDLDPAQQSSVRTILDDRRTKMEALRQETVAKSREVKSAMRAEIAKILKPEQRAKYEAMMANVDKHNRFKEAP